MYIIFIEYRIQEERWHDFAQLIPEIRRDLERVEEIRSHSFLTGSEQPHLVVEMVQLSDWQTYQQIRKLRLEEPTVVTQHLLTCVVNAKVNIWAFQPVEGEL